MTTVTSRPPGLRGYDARWYDSTGTALVGPDGRPVSTPIGSSLYASETFRRKLALRLNAIWNASIATIPPIILFKGDSLFAGTKTTGADHVDGRKNSLVAQLARMLTEAGLPANHEGFLGGRTAATIAEYEAYDPRTDFGTGWSVQTSALGTRRFQQGSVADPLAFTPEAAFDKFLVLYAKTPGQGSFLANVDGGASLGTTDAGVAGSPALGVVTYTATLATQTINIIRVAGTFSILGILPWDSTRRQVMLVNASAGGVNSGGSAANAFAWDQLNGPSYLSPVLTVLSQGINDLLTSVSVTDIGINLQSQITVAKTTGECLLVVPPPLGVSSASFAIQSALEAEYLRLATANDCGLVYSVRTFGDAVSANADGLMGADLIHPSLAGTAVWAKSIAAVLLDR